MRFSIVGISHWKSDVSIRELFYLDGERKDRLRHYTRYIPGGAVVLDTCNRTEMYGFCAPEVLIKALCESTNTKPEFLHEHGYIHTDEDAYQHLFRVGIGLDSQVLGDVQIIQQLKKAYKEASKNHLSGEFHQLFQSVLKAHKRSRTETDFGRGSASVGFAATQVALEHFKDLSDIQILLIGAGKMGKVSCKNLISNGAQHISLVNRSIHRAKNLASSFDIKAHSFEKLQAEIEKADLIITATGATEPIVRPEHLKGTHQDKLLIDLSVPRNIDTAVANIDGITLIDMDSITEANAKAIEQRKQAIPILQQIIDEELSEYLRKIDRNNFMLPRIKEIEDRLSTITDSELEQVKNKLDNDAYKNLEKVTHRIKKKIMAIHIDRLDKEFEKILNDA